MPYAVDTQVSPGRSREEIERTLMRYEATGFAYGWEGELASIMFAKDGRRIRFVLAMPERESFSFTPTGRARSEAQIQAEFEKATRQRWRALALVIKAKLEAVETGIATFEEEFLAHTVLPDGRTVGQAVLPQIEESYRTGQMPPLLGIGPGS